MKSRILLVGATGLFGRAFCLKTAKDGEFDLVGISRRLPEEKLLVSFLHLLADITEKDNLLKTIQRVKPDIIIHAASLGDVDYCEKYKKEAWKTNVEGTRNIITAAKEMGAKLIFLSTNAIYDGENPPYHEESVRKPIDYYGKTKLICEDDIKNSRISWTIVRLMTMYGWHEGNQRKNPVTWLIDGFKKGQKMNIVDDIYNNHLYVDQAVDAVLRIIKFEKWNETYNIAGRDSISRYQLAVEVADIFSFDKRLIFPVSSDFFPNLAPRPKNTSFVTKRAQRDLRIKPLSVKEGLKLMKENPL